MATNGYARVSTEGQELTAQLEQLNAAGSKVFQEKVSKVKQEHPQPAAILEDLREGDTAIIRKLERIARSTRHLLEVVEALGKKRVSFKVLNINLDTSTPTGKLMLSMLAAIGQFEREGIRTAKEQGACRGRKVTARALSGQVLDLLAQGRNKQAVADELKIGIASVYRITKAATS